MRSFGCTVRDVGVGHGERVDEHDRRRRAACRAAYVGTHLAP